MFKIYSGINIFEAVYLSLKPTKIKPMEISGYTIYNNNPNNNSSNSNNNSSNSNNNNNNNDDTFRSGQVGVFNVHIQSKLL